MASGALPGTRKAMMLAAPNDKQPSLTPSTGAVAGIRVIRVTTVVFGPFVSRTRGEVFVHTTRIGTARPGNMARNADDIDIDIENVTRLYRADRLIRGRIKRFGSDIV